MFQVVYGTSEPLAKLAPHVPPNVAQAIERALAKDPAARFGGMGELVLALTGKPLRTIRGRNAASAGSSAPPSSRDRLGDAAYDATATPASKELAPVRPPSAREVGAAATAASDGGAAQPVGGAATELPATRQPSASPLPIANPPGAAPAPAARPARVFVWVGLALAAAGGAYAYLHLAGGDHSPAGAIDAGAHTTAPLAKPPLPDAAATTTTPPIDAALVRATDAAPAPRTRPGSAGGHGAARSTPAESPLPPEVAADLDEAEHALEAGNWQAALRSAERSLRTHRTSRAFEIRARAYCASRDLGGAQAELRNVPAGQRAAVKRQCKARYNFEVP
jgi:hypothetical protein